MDQKLEENDFLLFEKKAEGILKVFLFRCAINPRSVDSDPHGRGC